MNEVRGLSLPLIESEHLDPEGSLKPMIETHFSLFWARGGENWSEEGLEGRQQKTERTYFAILGHVAV